MQATRFSNAPVPLEADVYLAHYADALKARSKHIKDMEKRLTGGKISIADFASAHEFFGLHKTKTGWVFREWAPLAESITLFGDFSNWEKREEFKLSKLKNGVWELKMPLDTLRHGDNYLMNVSWSEGNGDRIPAYARRVVQDEMTGLFCAVVWDPEEKYQFRYAPPAKPDSLLVYESHVGMAQEDPKVGSFTEFKDKILPRIARAGYNTVQLMAIMGHPYYGSFGYHVANFFAVSSRFGTPEELKALVDEAHRLGLRVIIDLVHSHAVRNEVEGLGRIDGTSYAYFHAGERGVHANWDSLCFDYGKPEVLHFLLSNCRYYLDEFNVDGFRFDGVTSMLYLHHGLGHCFTSYSEYFNNEVDEDAAAYLALANKVIHSVRPDAVTVAEDVSGMPGLGADLSQDGGLGFDYRMAMGVTDMWFKLLDQVDEHWNMFYLYGELTNRRRDERTISYVECHDQAIVGGKTAISLTKGRLISGFDEAGIEYVFVEYNGFCAHKAAREYAEKALELGADAIIGVGGGRAMDFSKLCGVYAKLPTYTVPTSLSTCAAFTTLSVIYDESGKTVGNYYLEEEVRGIFVDYGIMINQPVR
ncbi:MAG: iron-containing alcohol dehydrogenase, partial [Lentisphaeria bacterium]|nr:iron-containing alcohol dehydrogenase [Lentisphaeria bacterium]